jgi:hypothetical protein
VRRLGTTICCSALALAAASVQLLADAKPSFIPIFPAQQQWTLALNNALTAPPGFNGARGYFPIEGERLVAYDLVSGNQLWLVSSQAVWPPVAGDGFVFVVHPDAILALADDGRLPAAAIEAVSPSLSPITAGLSRQLFPTVSVRVADGSIGWRKPAPGSAPAGLTADRLHLPGSPRAGASERDGAVVWERRLGGRPRACWPSRSRLRRFGRQPVWPDNEAG